MVDDIERFRCLEDLDASPCEMFNVPRKQAYGTTFQQRSSDMGETVGVIDIN